MLENNIKNLIKILEDSKVDELEISTFWGKQKIKIRKNLPQSSNNIYFIQFNIIVKYLPIRKQNYFPCKIKKRITII